MHAHEAGGDRRKRAVQRQQAYNAFGCVIRRSTKAIG
jgi:hypothetical protein